MTDPERSYVKNVTRHDNAHLPIACGLSGPDLAERRRELAGDVFEGALGVEDLEDGYAFVFPGSAEWATRLIQLINAERACCPFFAFGLHFEPEGGPIRLRVRGPEGTKEFVKAELVEPGDGPLLPKAQPEA